MKEKVIVSSFTLITSLGAYFYAKAAQKDVVPYMMVSGFLGAMIGEAISQVVGKDDNNKPKKFK